MIECWNSYVWPRLITDDPAYYLVSNGIQEIRENGFGRENIPAMMAAVVVISRALDPFIPCIPQKDHGRRIERRNQKDEITYKAPASSYTDSLSASFAGCHGSQRTNFLLCTQEAFDTSKDYEITFWAKNDTNKTPDRYL